MPNSFDPSLITDVLRDTAITVLQSRLAPLNAFSTDFSADEIAPRKTVQVPIATSGSTTLVNPSSFESGDSALDNVAVTVNQYAQPFHVTNNELQQGHRLERLAKINLHQLANRIIDVALAPVTEANFGAAAVDVNSADQFSPAELKTLWASLKDGDVRNVVLDGSLYAQFLPTNLESFNVAANGRNAGMYGFDGFFYNNRFNGAGVSILGFACSPQAIAVASGLPASSPVDAAMLAQDVITIPDLGLSVQYNLWTSSATRSLWASYDVMFGAAKGDGSALKIVKVTP